MAMLNFNVTVTNGIDKYIKISNSVNDGYTCLENEAGEEKEIWTEDFYSHIEDLFNE